ncbi:helix-turn-helix domain-containing protein [Actinokineospora spheciospongiae]|uniref:helix-turn-helix domain-containing protein n=1 Tax=Actinokineospora spheciospongiae TaxID=909613 RepID=UPI0015E8614B|nr:helix-turn-helix transcriptional regulator [Actinokineospora spheciospongiae]
MKSTDPGPVVQRLIFGARARELRERAGVELEAANVALGWYRGKLSKVETGQLATKPRECDEMLRIYGVSGHEAEQLRSLAADGRRSAAPERVTDSARQYVALERDSTEIRMVYNEVPGIFQTVEYARAQLMRSPVIPGAQVAGMAQARHERGERLRSSGIRVLAVLGIEALYRETGGQEVLARQLERLVEMAGLPNVTIRILPWAAGGTPGLSCPFTLLWIEPANARIAYTETLTGADYLKTTDTYSLAFEQASDLALGEEASQDELKRRIIELE